LSPLLWDILRSSKEFQDGSLGLMEREAAFIREKKGEKKEIIMLRTVSIASRTA